MITTSYFGNRKKPEGTLINIARYNLSKEYEWLSSFAPSKKLLSSYKNKEISWDEYVDIYKNEQKTHFIENPNDFVNLLKRGTIDNIILCCYEKYKGPKTECHRFILYNLLKELSKSKSMQIKFIEEK